MPYQFESAATCGEEREIALNLPRDQLVDAVLHHSWDACVATTMRAISDRPDCPLLAVLFMFDLAEAGEYSEAGRDSDGGFYDLFDRIETRINAGGYTHHPQDHVPSDIPAVTP